LPRTHARVSDLEKRLEGALQRETERLKREAEAHERLQTREQELVEALERQTASTGGGHPLDRRSVLVENPVTRLVVRRCAGRGAGAGVAVPRTRAFCQLGLCSYVGCQLNQP